MVYPARRVPLTKAVLFFLAAAAFLGAFMPLGRLSGQEAEEPSRTVAVIPIESFIDGGLLDSIGRRIAEAEALDPALIIFRIDTYGGYAQYAMEITELIGGISEPKTVAYVPTKAYSAGAMIAMGAQEIVMGPRASFGDVAPVVETAEGPQILNEKAQSPTREILRKYAQLHGYPEALAEAMVTPEVVVYEVTFENGAVKYLSSEELDALQPAEQAKISRKEIVDKATELLTMTADEAKRYGFARFIAEDLSQVLAGYSLAGANVVTLRTSWSEEMVRKLNHPAVASILLLVALIAVYMEFKVPGFGLPGAVAIVCFGVLIFSKYLSGMASYWEIILFVVGVALLAVELFLIPGFGFVGFAGIALIVCSLILMVLPEKISAAPIDVQYVSRNAAWFIGTLVAAFVIAMGLAKVLPRTPILGQVFLGAPPESTVAHSEGAMLTEGTKVEVGAVGKAASPLRPAGKAVFGETLLDVTSRGDMIPEGVLVEIVAKKGNNIIVKAVK